MPIVSFEPSKITLEVDVNTRLFDAAKQAELPVASSCGGDFACGKCHMTILKGEKNLSPQSEAEKELLTRQAKPVTDRISCVALVLGDCTVTTTYW